MRILFLTQVLPYPTDAGPKVRAYYTLRHLARRHEVVLLSFVRRGDSVEALEHLRGFCKAVRTVPMPRSRAAEMRHLLRSLPTDTPFLLARDWIPDMARLVRSLATATAGRGYVPCPGFDAVHADQLWMAPYALLARQVVGGSDRPFATLDQHNAVFQIPRRLALHETNPLKRALLMLEERKLARYEADVCRRFDQVVWVSEQDQAAVQRRMVGGCRQSAVIPICVDPARQRKIETRPNAHRVTFLGGLHWPPNAEGIVWFAREIWPLVRQRAPGARLTVIGKDPPRSLVAGGALGAGIDVAGYISDPTPYLAETAVFVVPLRAGGGMRVKILDAWCWGLPVVTTHIGAEGISVHDGDDALVADTPGAFAEAVVRVFQEPDLAARLSVAGRHSVEAHYDWRKRYHEWDRVFASRAHRGA
jgi:glycosyltransferase involved in cell wall biosynthesis